MSNPKKSRIEILGYGSLLSEKSARATAPDLQNFRLVEVHDRIRIFNKVGIIFFKKYGLKIVDQKISSCATRVIDGAKPLIASVFDVSESDFLELYQREHRFRWTTASYSELNTETLVGHARICTEWNDDDYQLNKCVTPSNYQEEVGQYYSGKIWRDDILPFPTYLSFCLAAAKTQGQAVFENFLETSFLADGVTSIGVFLDSQPEYFATAQDYANK